MDRWTDEHTVRDDSLAQRAARHAALGDPTRLAIVDELTVSDRAPSELAARLRLPTNLLAHHLATLERADLVERAVSSGDRRRRYVRLRDDALAALLAPVRVPIGPALFVCTHNSARSQLAAAIWTARTGERATSAGTEPVDRVHPGAVAAATRRGLDLLNARPQRLDPVMFGAVDVVVSVCDRAHEESGLPATSLHWSVPDPVLAADDPAAFDPAPFDRAADLLDRRITALIT